MKNLKNKLKKTGKILCLALAIGLASCGKYKTDKQTGSYFDYRVTSVEHFKDEKSLYKTIVLADTCSESQDKNYIEYPSLVAVDKGNGVWEYNPHKFNMHKSHTLKLYTNQDSLNSVWRKVRKWKT